MATYQKFVKSFHIFEEMFIERKAFRPDLYEPALLALKKYIHDKENRFAEDFTRHDISLDFGAIRLIYNMDEKLDPRELKQSRRQFIQEKSEGIQHYIFVLTKPFSSAADMANIATQTNELTKFVRKTLKKTNEIFFLKEVQYNVTKHYMVPKHEVIKNDKHEEILQTYGLQSKTQLPLLLTSDPVVRFIGGQEGDIIKVTRMPQHVGEHVLYRYCVSP